jgi:hypothetical protein
MTTPFVKSHSSWSKIGRFKDGDEQVAEIHDFSNLPRGEHECPSRKSSTQVIDFRLPVTGMSTKLVGAHWDWHSQKPILKGTSKNRHREERSDVAI